LVYYTEVKTVAEGLQSRVLRNVFGSQKEAITSDWSKFLRWNFIVCAPR